MITTATKLIIIAIVVMALLLLLCLWACLRLAGEDDDNADRILNTIHTRGDIDNMHNNSPDPRDQSGKKVKNEKN